MIRVWKIQYRFCETRRYRIAICCKAIILNLCLLIFTLRTIQMVLSRPSLWLISYACLMFCYIWLAIIAPLNLSKSITNLTVQRKASGYCLVDEKED